MRKGFTLIELLVVMTIIAILIAVAVPGYTRVKERARIARVRASLANMVKHLENFALNNQGYYPGVAADLDGVDDCTGDGIPEKSYSCYTSPDHPGVFPSAGVLGTKMSYMVRIAPPVGEPGGPVRTGILQPDKAMWDRLYLDGTVDEYDMNPFYNQGPFPRPMANVFEAVIPVQANNQEQVAQDGFGRPVYVLPCLSVPDAISGGAWYTDAGFNASARNTALAARRPVNGPCPEPADYLNSLNGWEPFAGGSAPLQYPVGEFAYIPLDPVVWPDRDNNGAIDHPMFMVYVRNYLLIGYGGTNSWQSKTWDVDFIRNTEGGLRFEMPLGRVNLNDLTSLENPPTIYEEMALRALRGAVYVSATKYTDQFERTRR